MDMRPAKVVELSFLLGLWLTGAQLSAGQSDMTVSIFTVTSKSITVQWSPQPGTTSYRVTADPINSPDSGVFALFSGNTVIGSVTPLSPNTVYSVTVEALDNVTVLGNASMQTSTAPDVPVIEDARAESSDSVTVSFATVPGASSYVLRAEAEPDFFSETPVSGSPALLRNLQPYTDYTFSIMSVNGGGRSQPSQPVDMRTVVSAPILNASSPSNNSIYLTWSKVNYAANYSLIITKTQNSWAEVNTSETSAMLTDLEPGTTYCITVNAWGLNGTPGDNATTCQITRPPTPGLVYFSLASSRSMGLDVFWNLVEGADTYLVVSSLGYSCNTSNDTCVISPLSCSQNHTINVQAMNWAGSSFPSDPLIFFTSPCTPGPIWVQEPNPGNCTLLWGAVPLVEYYSSFIKRDDGEETFCNTTKSSCNFACECGFTFFMSVFALLTDQYSPPGDANYTTIPCCARNISISLVSTETLEITWPPSRGADLYETTAAETSHVIHCNDTAPVCALSDLQCNTGYNIVVTPCSEITGCTSACVPHFAMTAPCSPQILNVNQTGANSVNISWFTSNSDANYTVNILGGATVSSCWSKGTSCQVSNLPCGTSFEVSAVAATSAGSSLPSYSIPLETAPCCPQALTVVQVTQAMTNVTWSGGRGAQSYVTSLTSLHGDAKCHTMETHCLMGCITCGMNYTVSLEAISSTGHASQCSYSGFSSACCPSKVQLYKTTNNTILIQWRAFQGPGSYTASLSGSGSNYTCSSGPGGSSCQVSQVICGDIYTVIVSPQLQEGGIVDFCPRKMYTVTCSGSSIGLVIYRGKRSLA